MSAKWRRNKRNNKSDFLRTIDKCKKKHSPRIIRIKKSWIKRQDHTCNKKITRINFGRKSKEPEPLIDVLENNNSVTVVADLAGFERKNITVRVNDQRLTLSAKGSNRKYHKSLNLPKRVIASNMRTKYKNGVLEIILKKSLEEKAVGELAGQKNAT
jgi:HSP20 family molecular chaperone IbpA